jgi:hypothetical protein
MPVRPHRAYEKLLHSSVAQAVVQTGAMIFFMRVARWDSFVSAGLSAVIGMVSGWVLYLIQKPKSAHEG